MKASCKSYYTYLDVLLTAGFSLRIEILKVDYFWLVSIINLKNGCPFNEKTHVLLTLQNIFFFMKYDVEIDPGIPTSQIYYHFKQIAKKHYTVSFFKKIRGMAT